jgi:hypothetical protein
VVPGFHCSFLPGMPSSPTPGSPTSTYSRTSMPISPSPYDHRLGTPNRPAIRSTRASHFVASLVRYRYGLPGCSPPCTDQTGTPQPSGTFTSRLSTARSPSPSLDITSTVTGLLCWRDSHPLEWQLASLHGHGETNSPRAFLVGGPSDRMGPGCSPGDDQMPRKQPAGYQRRERMAESARRVGSLSPSSRWRIMCKASFLRM